jgi:hypothetical protein
MKFETKVFWAIVVAILVWAWFQPYDSTDDTLRKERSGLAIYTDHGTGCQYVGRFFGGLTPRLDKDGKPMCNVALPTGRQRER